MDLELINDVFLFKCTVLATRLGVHNLRSTTTTDAPAGERTKTEKASFSLSPNFEGRKEALSNRRSDVDRSGGGGIQTNLMGRGDGCGREEK